MRVFVGDEQLWISRLGLPKPDGSTGWTLVSADQPLPPASVYLDLSGHYAQKHPAETPADAYWMVHAPEYTLAELPPNTIRFNGWPGFSQGNEWEVVAVDAVGQEICSALLQSLGKQPILVPDQIGFIGARVLASVINEAYLLLGEGSASRSDIDLAMKLGTNYPMGPFEWSEQIGLPAVHALLKRLAENDPRYEPAPALTSAIQTQ
jgi:hypothetical protein